VLVGLVVLVTFVQAAGDRISRRFDHRA